MYSLQRSNISLTLTGFSFRASIPGWNTTAVVTYTFASTPSAHVHQYVTKFDKTYHWRECTAGDYTSQKEEHSWDAWVVDKAATETETGLRHRACLVCGYAQKETVPVKKEAPDDPVLPADELPEGGVALLHVG